jgi:ABC-type polysaccharide/polyol phosphate export permease
MAGALFLVSGVVFPLAVLPAPLQVLGMLTPLTWWIEGVRHAVFPTGPSSVGGPGSSWTALSGSAAPDSLTIIAALLGTGALVTLAATAVFRVSERRAKERGLLDRTTGS